MDLKKCNRLKDITIYAFCHEDFFFHVFVDFILMMNI